MRIITALIILFLPGLLMAQPDTTQHVVPGRSNSRQQQQKPYVILISIDGLRYDLVDKYHATHLQQLRNNGVAAIAMIPSYPSLTFPNHYTLVTGLYPAHHGLVDNTFYDKKRNETYRSLKPQGKWKTAAGITARLYGYWPNNSKWFRPVFYWAGSEAAGKAYALLIITGSAIPSI